MHWIVAATARSAQQTIGLHLDCPVAALAATAYGDGMRILTLSLLSGLVACTTHAPGEHAERLAPSFTGMLPMAAATEN
jgi:hypothetical protein